MNGKQEQIIIRNHDNPYKIVTEPLGDGSSDLKSFYFRYGANIYVFSYQNGGIRSHTFIDSGDFMYRKSILATLRGNDIEPGNIERIIITHRHRDHCGLIDTLAGKSKAKILVHENFRSFVEGKVSTPERRRLGGFDPSCLREYSMIYLSACPEESLPISNLNFPRLTEPIEIGHAGHLNIFACPESVRTHAPDQLVVLYSPLSSSQASEKTNENFRPTDDIIFAGDLWLMHGPLFVKGLRGLRRNLIFAYYRTKGFLSGKPFRLWDPREQDMEAKEALKRGFPLIRVKPGHGEEFLGTRIIPSGLLADRDILCLLGYDMDEDKSLLKTDSLATSVSDIKEKANVSFAKELIYWINQGYKADEISDILLRIYREQKGGGPLVAEDRRERRERLKHTMSRLRDEEPGVDVLRQIVELTLPKLF